MCVWACVRVGVTASVPKTNVMSVNSPPNESVRVSGEAEVEAVSSFTHLGSVIHRDGLSWSGLP